MIFDRRVYFECIVPEQNKRAFYDLVAGVDLFGYILLRRWGRIGSKGRPKRQRFHQKAEMLKEFERIYLQRVKHNYTPILTVKSNQ